MHIRPTIALKAKYGGYHAPTLIAMLENNTGRTNIAAKNPMTQITFHFQTSIQVTKEKD